ncbi:VapA/VapB family virulence-associated protein [Bacillus altitudinis]|uniref:VapA/VapB family virulence-associated protein n=1 Tax=Bacillus altitudinis TaxID=293387 RepID=UPI00093498DD|nr:VapA/VapB family virulence-associated protein [Bacillus altitudinis]OJT65705.1 hypothetical protein BFP48_00485 [Bacillus altitudinis]
MNQKITQSDIDKRVTSDLKQLLEENKFLEPKKINEIITKAEGVNRTTHKGYFRTAGALFYTHYWIWTPNTEAPYAKFNGNAGGLALVNLGAGEGDIYTDDLEAVIDNTVSFGYLSTLVYFSVYFFDKHSNLLGHFQAGGVGTTLGTGGGTGKWIRTPPE